MFSPIPASFFPSEFYDNLEQSGELKPLDGVSIGDFGVAKYSDDSRWYRARLLTAEEHNRIKIVYIDFGNIETKYIDEFFPLDKLYTDLPAQAIACTLSDVRKGKGGGWNLRKKYVFCLNLLGFSLFGKR